MNQGPSPLRALVALVGVVAFFVPFAADYSPLKAVFGGYWMYGGPAFLTLPITIGYLRGLKPGPMSSRERSAYFALAIVGAFVVFYPWIWSMLEDPGSIDFSSSWLATAVVVAAPVFVILGGVVAWKMRWMASPPEAPGVFLMRVVYVANAWICLNLFRGDLQIGAWLVLAVTVFYVAIILSVLRQSFTIQILHT